MQGWLLTVLRCWLGAPRGGLVIPEPTCAREATEFSQEQSVSFCACVPVGTPGHLGDLNPAGLCIGASPRNKRTKSCPMRVGGKILGSLKVEINMGNLPAGPVANMPHSMQGSWVQSLGWEDPLEKGIATHSSILVWRTPWTEEPGGLQSVGLPRVRHN